MNTFDKIKSIQVFLSISFMFLLLIQVKCNGFIAKKIFELTADESSWGTELNKACFRKCDITVQLAHSEQNQRYTAERERMIQVVWKKFLKILQNYADPNNVQAGAEPKYESEREMQIIKCAICCSFETKSRSSRDFAENMRKICKRDSYLANGNERLLKDPYSES